MSIVSLSNKLYGLKDGMAGVIAVGTKHQMEKLMFRIMKCAVSNDLSIEDWSTVL